MKRTNHGASALRRLSVMLLAVMLLTSLLCSGSAYALDAGDVSRMNVMLVIDGSGSLTMSGGTDLDGNRYHAIDLFLALLTNSGNNVGAIVFDHDIRLNAPISPINGKADKEANDNSLKWAEEINTPVMTSGSDCHRESGVGLGGIITTEPIKSNEDLLRILKSGKYELIKNQR